MSLWIRLVALVLYITAAYSPIYVIILPKSSNSIYPMHFTLMGNNTLVTFTIYLISGIDFIIIAFIAKQSKYFSSSFFNYNKVILSGFKLINSCDLSSHRIIAFSNIAHLIRSISPSGCKQTHNYRGYTLISCLLCILNRSIHGYRKFFFIINMVIFRGDQINSTSTHSK